MHEAERLQRSIKGMGEKAIGNVKLDNRWLRWKPLFKGKTRLLRDSCPRDPEEHPKDCIVELYVTDKEMSILEIKVNADNEKLELLSRSIVLGDLLPVTSIGRVVEEMKDTAERREKENPNNSISTNYTLR